MEVSFYEAGPRPNMFAQTSIPVAARRLEVRGLWEKVFGNDPANDFSLKLPVRSGGKDADHVYIRPEDAKILLAAAELLSRTEPALQPRCTMTVQGDGRTIGTLEPREVQEALKQYR